MRKKLQQAEELFFKLLMRSSVIIIVLMLTLIIASVFYKGFPALSWQMISQTPQGGYYFGKSGGVLNAIIGSIYLASGATLLAFIMGLPIVLLININLKKHKKLVNTIRFLLDLLWGIPSIVYGAFGFTVMIILGVKASLLAGIITVAVIIIPIMIRAMDEVMRNVPAGLLEASMSVGSNKTQTGFIVYLRQCSSAIITAVMISFGRAIGDTAAVLFTTGYTDNVPTSLMQPTATLPLSVFFQLNSPIPEVQSRAYASAAILTIIILIISISTRVLSGKYNKNKIS